MLGIIAGKGNLIANLIAECDRQNKPYFILAFEGQTDSSLLINRFHAWTTLGKIGHGLALLHQHHITEIVMAGHFKRPAWSELSLDSTGMRWLGQLMGRSLGDDGLLKRIIKLLEADGFKVVSPESILGTTLFIPEGNLGNYAPNQDLWRDIHLGYKVLRHLSDLDIGQAIVVQQELILGIEAIEGTQELLHRCQNYRREGSQPVLVKLSKKQQETRVDRPTVGLETLESLINMAYAGMAVEANCVIMLDQQHVIAKANEHHIFITGIMS